MGIGYPESTHIARHWAEQSSCFRQPGGYHLKQIANPSGNRLLTTEDIVPFCRGPGHEGFNHPLLDFR